VIDFKCRTDRPSIFYTKDSKTSYFFKDFMWPEKSAKMGLRWKVGNERKIKFWEDNRLGSSSLAIHY
jgi:hypothetical protein